MNMAIDEAILRSTAKGGPPTLRFYGWEPPAISVGYFQDVQHHIDAAACKSLGIDVVRRPTGGRAVLHDVEVTYSLAIPEENPTVPKGITESYRAISEGMVQGLSRLGLDAKMVSLRGRARKSADAGERGAAAPRSGRYEVAVEAAKARPSSSACFDAPSWYEVTVDGRKVVGSAQVRRMGVLLQHGSILLELDADKLFACLRFPSAEERQQAKEAFLEKATSIRAALGRPVSFLETCDAVVAGLEEALGVRIEEGQLTAEELQDAEALAAEKYKNLEWGAPPAGNGSWTA